MLLIYWQSDELIAHVLQCFAFDLEYLFHILVEKGDWLIYFLVYVEMHPATTVQQLILPSHVLLQNILELLILRQRILNIDVRHVKFLHRTQGLRQ